MPARESPPPTLRGIMFILFLMFLLTILPIALVIWLITVLPWQFSAGVTAGMFIMFFARRRKHD
jgi:hypothetical protein